MVTGDFVLIGIGETNETTVNFGTLDNEVKTDVFDLGTLGGSDWSAVNIIAVAGQIKDTNTTTPPYYNKETGYVAVDAGQTPTWGSFSVFNSAMNGVTVGHATEDTISVTDLNSANFLLSPSNAAGGFVTNLIADANLGDILNNDIYMDIWSYTYDSFAGYTGLPETVYGDTGVDLHIWADNGEINAELATSAVPIPISPVIALLLLE